MCNTPHLTGICIYNYCYLIIYQLLIILLRVITSFYFMGLFFYLFILCCYFYIYKLNSLINYTNPYYVLPTGLILHIINSDINSYIIK
jgi:hypothetical protein